jgi:hypothetical protein
MNVYMKEGLKWLAVGSTVAAIGISQGCATAPQMVCRHQAVACALAAGERYGSENVKIARGPAVGDVESHAQAIRYDSSNNIVWLSNEDCSTSKRDSFSPIEYIDVSKYVEKIVQRRW